MEAIVKRGGAVALRSVVNPRARRDRDVTIRVAWAGICRTDLAVAQGRIASAPELVLGHEFSGRVEEVGRAVTRFGPGDRVTAMPVFDCGACAGCRRGLGTCESPSMLGVDLDGAFAEVVVVPESAVHAIPPRIDLQTAAYAEPVAACLAVTRARISPEQRGAIIGSGRIAELTRRVMRAEGFDGIETIDPETLRAQATSSLDFAVETSVSSELFREIVRLVRPRGRVVVKSRHPDPVSVDFPTLIRKELSLEAVNYGSFERSIELLAGSGIPVADLFGPVYPLASFPSAFDSALSGESKKLFFRIDDAAPSR